MPLSLLNLQPSGLDLPLHSSVLFIALLTPLIMSNSLRICCYHHYYMHSHIQDRISSLPLLPEYQGHKPSTYSRAYALLGQGLQPCVIPDTGFKPWISLL